MTEKEKIAQTILTELCGWCFRENISLEIKLKLQEEIIKELDRFEEKIIAKTKEQNNY